MNASEFKRVMQEYGERFSPVSPGVLRIFATLEQTDKLGQDLAAALTANSPISDLPAYAGKFWNDSMREKMAGSTATA